MTWYSTPGLMVGEFDAQAGPKIFAVSQLFAHVATSSASAIVSASPGALLDPRTMLTGANVATGFVRDGAHDALRPIAVRALATSDHSTAEDVVLWVEPAGSSPCHASSCGFGSVTFHLGDIFARGEKRKFCLVAYHPQHDVLIAKWPMLVAMMASLISAWRTAAQRLVESEYSKYGATLPAMRESARRHGLRSMFDMIAASSSMDSLTTPLSAGDDEEVVGEASLVLGGAAAAHEAARSHRLWSVHAAADALLGRLFGAPRIRAVGWASTTMLCGGDTLPPGAAAWRTRRYLNDRLSRDETCLAVADADTANQNHAAAPDATTTTAVVYVDRQQPQLAPPNVVVPPLAFLLREVVGAECGRSAWRYKIGLLLKALLSGGQLIVSAGSEAADRCGTAACQSATAADISEQWALSLAQFLPRPLRHVVTRSDTYRESYQCRILSFSDAFLAQHDIVPLRDWDTRSQLVLAELNAVGAVHVAVGSSAQRTARAALGDHTLLSDSDEGHMGCITVDDCDALIAGQARPSSSSTAVEWPTVVRSMLDLIEASCVRLPPSRQAACGVGAMKAEVMLLHSQLQLALQVCTSRARVYVRCFQAQEQLRNRDVLLGRDAAQGQGSRSLPAGGKGSLLHKLSSWFNASKGKSQRDGSTTGRQPVDGAEAALDRALSSSEGLHHSAAHGAYRTTSSLSVSVSTRLLAAPAGPSNGGGAAAQRNRSASCWGAPLVAEQLFASAGGSGGSGSTLLSADHMTFLFLGACKAATDG